MTDTPENFLTRHYFRILAVVLLAKVLLAWLVPVTGDEAYFYIWGLFPDYGYYDHPPMAGWWFALVMWFTEHPVALRSLAILASVLPALGVYALFRRHDEQQARLASLLMLFVPLFMIGILITTDTPLILFGLLSIWFCQRGIVSGSKPAFLFSGVLLGLAFLGKYFAALIGVGFLVHFLLFARHRFSGLLLIVLGTLPAIALNLYWNWQHCGYNIMFNLVNRHGGDGAEWGNLPLYLVSLVYLFMPWVLWQLWRHRDRVRNGIREHQLGVWLTTTLAPLALFLLLSPVARIGLHWLAVFVPGLLLAVYFLPSDALRRSVVYSAIFSALHVLLLAAILALPLDRFQSHRSYGDALLYLQPEKIGALFDEYSDDITFLTSSYSRSAVLSYYSRHYFSVWGDGSRYGRQDDLITDFRALDGTDMVYFPRRGEVDVKDMAPFFDNLHIRETEVAGLTLQIAEGRGFRYAVYRERVLDDIQRKYYRFPEWLPVGECGFTEKYQLD